MLPPIAPVPVSGNITNIITPTIVTRPNHGF
jgi:hypothetical protein